MYVNQEDSKVRQLGQNIGMTMPTENLKLGRGMMEREKSRKYNMMAKRQAMYNKVNFSMDKMTKDFGKILDRYLPKFEEQPQQVDLKLPKLKKVGNEPENVKLPKLKKV